LQLDAAFLEKVDIGRVDDGEVYATLEGMLRQILVLGQGRGLVPGCVLMLGHVLEWGEGDGDGEGDGVAAPDYYEQRIGEDGGRRCHSWQKSEAMGYRESGRIGGERCRQRAKRTKEK